MYRGSRFGFGVAAVVTLFAACTSAPRGHRGGGTSSGDAGGGGVGGGAGVGGAGGAVGAGGASSSSSGASSSSSGGAGCLGGGGLIGACAPVAPVCNAVPSKCIALDDPCGTSVSTLRMSQLTINAPAVLASGLVANIVGNSVLMNMAECNLEGSGTFSWLLQFDEVAGKLTTGAARPEADPTQGYCMMNEILGGKVVAPVGTSVVIGPDGSFSASTIPAVTIPIFLDAGGSSFVLLPMQKLSFHDGKLSPERRCIGEYNADGLSPQNNCLAEPPAVLAFDNAATLDAFITLEDADDIIIDTLQQSLCVLLSGDQATYGNGGNPSLCKRDINGKIVFAGDWCAATNQAATAACHDASRFNASFAASAVKVKGGC